MPIISNAALHRPTRLGSLIILATLTFCVTNALGRDGDPALDRCRAIPDGPARLRCYDESLPKAPPAATLGSSRDIGGWRLVRTPHPRGGPEVVSIMRAADPSRSAAEFVGLMLRCGAPEIEVLPVVIPPLPPRARPKVTIGSGSDVLEMDATVTSPGAAILLPRQASDAVRARWLRLPRLEIAIAHDGATIGGSVSLEGLVPALQALDAACGTR